MFLWSGRDWFDKFSVFKPKTGGVIHVQASGRTSKESTISKMLGRRRVFQHHWEGNECTIEKAT
jgi:hypothetical protein